MNGELLNLIFSFAELLSGIFRLFFFFSTFIFKKIFHLNKTIKYDQSKKGRSAKLSFKLGRREEFEIGLRTVDMKEKHV